MPPESPRGTTSRHNTHIVSQDPWFRQLTMWVLCYTVIGIPFFSGLQGLFLLQKSEKKIGKIGPIPSIFPIRKFASSRDFN